MDLKYPYKKQDYIKHTTHAELILTQGKSTVIDLCDLNKCLAYKWSAYFDGFNWYATTNLPRSIKTKSRTMALHRFLLNPPSGMCIDHIDHNGLNNTRCNLRICNHRENTSNKKMFVNNTSGITGVVKKDYFLKRKNKLKTYWVAQIRRGDRVISKMFNSKDEAIKCRKEMECVPST